MLFLIYKQEASKQMSFKLHFAFRKKLEFWIGYFPHVTFNLELDDFLFYGLVYS
jgi:hypothetical protein